MRAGIRYSNGQPVEPGDFRHALERVLRLRSPGAAYYSEIVGAAGCLAKPATCDLSRGIITDQASRTVTFHLSQPDGDFQTKLALEFAAAVPASTPFRDVGGAIPGTGPYQIARFVKGRSVALVRNPRFVEWSEDAQPRGYPDSITIRLGGDYAKRLRAAEGGTDDVAALLGIGGSGPQLTDLAARYPGRLIVTTTSGLDYMFLNTRMPPFDDVRVRRALDVAVDREQLAERLGTLDHAPTCQILPPNFRAYSPRCPYRGGLAAARRIIARSGASGKRVAVWVPAPAAQIGRYFVTVLDEIGLRGSLKTVAPNQYFAVLGRDSRVQIGFVSWVSDYPTPRGFFEPLFACANPAGANFERFCDPAVERQMRLAAALQVQDEAAATLAWQKAEGLILDRAPIVPYSNPRNVDLVSRRLGDYEYSEQQGGFLLDQAWVR